MTAPQQFPPLVFDNLGDPYLPARHGDRIAVYCDVGELMMLTAWHEMGAARAGDLAPDRQLMHKFLSGMFHGSAIGLDPQGAILAQTVVEGFA